MPRKINGKAIEDVKDVYITKGRPDKNAFMDYINFQYIPEQIDNGSVLYSTGDELSEQQFHKLISMEPMESNQLNVAGDCGISSEIDSEKEYDDVENTAVMDYDEHKSKISDALKISIETTLIKANAMRVLANQVHSQAPLYVNMTEEEQEEYRYLASILEKSKISKELKDLSEAINYLQGENPIAPVDHGDRVIVLNDFHKSILNEKD